MIFLFIWIRNIGADGYINISLLWTKIDFAVKDLINRAASVKGLTDVDLNYPDHAEENFKDTIDQDMKQVRPEDITNEEKDDQLNYIDEQLFGGKESDINKIKPLLIDQITSRVRWRESIDFMIRQGVTSFLEIGPGKVLSGCLLYTSPSPRD